MQNSNRHFRMHDKSAEKLYVVSMVYVESMVHCINVSILIHESTCFDDVLLE